MTNHELARKLMEHPDMPVRFSIDDHAATGHVFEADPAILPMTFAAKSGDKFDCLLLDLGPLPDEYDEDCDEDCDEDKEITRIVVSIDWDAPKCADLPSEVTIDINEGNRYLLEDIDDAADNLCDWLSNEYGYCINGLTVEKVCNGSEPTNIKILLEAIGTRATVDDVCSNFCEGYPEFSSNMEEEDYKFDEKTGKFSLLWSGDFEEGELDEDSMNTLIRLTHHAEGFYEGTDAEHVHVEVCVNGEWHGRNQEVH
jgi:hypothetical protein